MVEARSTAAPIMVSVLTISLAPSGWSSTTRMLRLSSLGISATLISVETVSTGISNQKVLPSPSTLSTADRAAHQLGQLAADGQAEAGAAELALRAGFRLHERLEQSGARLFGNADAGVGDFPAQSFLVLGPVEMLRLGHDADRHRALGGEFDGVADEIHEDLAQPFRVAPDDEGHVVVDLVLERHRLVADLDRQSFDDALGEHAHRHLEIVEIEFRGVHLGEVEHVVENFQ